MTKSTHSKSRAPSSSLTNLPTPLTNFVGRRRETREVRQLISTTRCLTLTGASGCGKTRLALNAVVGLHAAFPDGIAWVEIGPLNDPALVAPTAVKAVGLREHSNQPPVENLISFLESKRLLLVLDDCDRLIPACAVLVETLLSNCPSLHILCTSREALGRAGETAWLVPSLSLPEALPVSQPADEMLSALGQSDAIQLFDERASSLLPTFHLTAENAAAVYEVCRRLDGIPLAIELAASRIKVLTVQQIASRLGDRFNLLTAGMKATLPRHRTLREAVDWSHDLLNDPERILFRRLAVFAGGWSLDAAETVSADRGAEEKVGQEKRQNGVSLTSPAERVAVPQTAVLDLLSHLIDKSMVVADTQRGSEARYHLLDTMREYADEKLEAAGEKALVQDGHREYFLQLAERIETESRGANQKAWFDRAELDHDNVRAALKWCAQTGAIESELRIASALQQFWIVRGYLREGRQWLEKGLSDSAQVPEATRAKALHAVGTLVSRQSDYAAARPFLEQALTIRRKLGDQHGISISLNNLASVAINQADYARARALLEESIAVKRALRDKAGLAYSLGNLGEVSRIEGNYEQASKFYEESLSLLRELGNKETVAMVLVSMGSLYRARGDYRRAAELFYESLRLAEVVGSKWASAMCIAGLAAVAQARGEPRHAARLLGAAEAQLEAIGSPLEPPDRAEYERNVANVRAQLDEESFTAAWAFGRALTLEQAVSEALGTEAPGPAERSIPIHSPAPQSPDSLRVFALGPVRVYLGERLLAPSDWTYAKAKELLFYLLSLDARTKEQIGVDLWPDASPAQLRSSFNVTVYHLRRALGNANWVRYENGCYRFNHMPDFWYDVEAFESGLTRARQIQTTAPSEAIQLFQKTLELYRGDFLQDLDPGEWQVQRREELQQMFLKGLVHLAELHFADQKYNDAGQVFRQAITRDPYFESAHRGLMRTYARLGELSQALRHYKMLVDLLRDELGGEPAPETKALYGQLRGGQRQ